MNDSQIFLAYRDILLPLSETFIASQYQSFSKLQPIFIGSKEGPGRHLLQHPIVKAGSFLEQTVFKHFGRLPKAFKSLASLQPKFIHAHFGRGGALALPICEALGLPLIVSFYGGDVSKSKHYQKHPLVQPIYLRRLASLKEKASLFICNSNFIKRRLIERGFPVDKIVVHLASVPSANIPLPKEEETDRIILFVGRLVEKKGLTYLIESMARVQKHFPDVKLVVVGDGQLRTVLEQQGTTIGARFIGWKSPSEVSMFMSKALAVAVPSVTANDGDTEGLPTIILEAMAIGVPVVGSNHAGIGEAIIDGNTGYICGERDVIGLAEALERLIADPLLRTKMRHAARLRATEEFDAAKQSERLETILLTEIRR